MIVYTNASGVLYRVLCQLNNIDKSRSSITPTDKLIKQWAVIGECSLPTRFHKWKVYDSLNGWCNFHFSFSLTIHNCECGIHFSSVCYSVWDIYLTVLYLVVALWMHIYMQWYVFSSAFDWLGIFLILVIAYWLLNQLNLVSHRLFTACIVVLCMEKLCIQEWIKGQ